MHQDKMIRPGEGGVEQRGLLTDVVVPIAGSGRVSRPMEPPPPPPQMELPPGVERPHN
jgi:hypothetical protein